MRQVPPPLDVKPIRATDFARLKAEGHKISLVTAYEAWSARLVAASIVDAILVGDSVAIGSFTPPESPCPPRPPSA